MDIKEHIEKHKIRYSCIATGVVVAGITAIIMKGRYEALAIGGAYGLKTADTSVTMRPLCFLSNQNNIVKVVNKYGTGRPGYLIRSLATNEYFSSQREAAAMFDISETLLSKHLAGKIPNVDGHQFERIYMAA